jgi:hypothetical protein
MNELRRTPNPFKRSLPSRSGPPSVFVPVMLTNAGVLVVLLFGPNSQHPIPALTYAGAAVALVGLVLIVRNLTARRRNPPFVPPARDR